MLKAAIAYIRTMMGGATPIQHAGPAHQGLIQQAGNNNSVSATKRRNQSAQPKPRRKSSLAQAGTTELSRKPKQKAAQPTSGETGLQQATPASQPVSQSRKRRPLVVLPITQEQSPKQTQKPVLIISGKGGLQLATPARPTRQPVKPAVKAKQARVLRTTRVQSQEPEQAPVQTLMDNPSGGRGKRKVTAQQILQPAPQAKTKKPKAAVLTTQVKKDTRSKTSVQTLTDSPSKGSGS